MPINLKKPLAAALLAATMSGTPARGVEPTPRPPSTSSKSHGINAQRVFDKVVNDLIEYEGTIAYQRSKGSYRNGRFYPYKDSRGYMTVGYGHKILPTENYSKGITEQEAKKMLSSDAKVAWYDAIELLREYNISLTDEQREVVMEILPNMTFQLGKKGVRDFKKMWVALRANDFKTASKEMLDSAWNKQTPSRAQKLAGKMKVIAN